jgi:S-adenosylmethionine hydrolase
MVKSICLILCSLLLQAAGYAQKSGLVIQSDFGVKDGAVAAMKGVAYGVSPSLAVVDLTHEIPAYNIWEAAYRLYQVAPYWPKGTVFVSVVDPGVGSDRKSVVLLTKTGHYFVSPDNGTLTLVAESMGIAALREIDERKNRLPHSNDSYTFHGRDVYAYTGARLAAGKISFAQVGPLLSPKVLSIPYQKALRTGDSLKGNIPVLDIQYGNIWTNIPDSLLKGLGLKYGDTVGLRISHNDVLMYAGEMPFVTTFTAVAEGQPLCYINSLMNVSFALNMGDFSAQHKVSSGAGWTVTIKVHRH